MERLEKFAPKRVYFSGDHNPQGFESLLEILPHYPCKNLWVIVGMGADKNIAQCFEKLKAVKNLKLILTETPFKGMPLQAELEIAKNLGLDVKHSDKDPHQALLWVLSQANMGDMLLVTGSLYLYSVVN
jgi:folylpolyglutamate synthase/dihydropteroate synthase